jgi:hypothetical protein
VVDDACPAHSAASSLWIEDVCLDELDPPRKVVPRVTRDRPDLEPSSDQLVYHGSAYRSESHDDVEQ